MQIAWRNMWRNPRRTLITAAAICLNTAILIISVGLMDGMRMRTVHNVTHLALGEAQVHATGYRAKRSFYDAIANPERVLRAADQAGIPAAPRSFGFGLLSSGNKSAGAEFWGIDVARETSAFTLSRHVDRGTFLPTEPGSTRSVVVGRKLARSLDVSVGSEIVAVVQAGDGSIGNELLTVVGILKSVSEKIDRSAVLMATPIFAELFASGGRVHQIALNSFGRLTSQGVAAAIAAATPDLEVLPWQQLNPALGEIIALWDTSIFIFSVIFFLAAAIGVMNTMLMAVFERMHEFGVIKALGGRPLQIVIGVATEAALLGLVAALFGGLLGLGGNVYLHIVGIDLSWAGTIAMSGIAFDPIWRADVTLLGTLWPIIAMVCVSVLAALYPAVKVARTNPIVAMNQV